MPYQGSLSRLLAVCAARRSGTPPPDAPAGFLPQSWRRWGMSGACFWDVTALAARVRGQTSRVFRRRIRSLLKEARGPRAAYLAVERDDLALVPNATHG